MINNKYATRAVYKNEKTESLTLDVKLSCNLSGDNVVVRLSKQEQDVFDFRSMGSLLSAANDQRTLEVPISNLYKLVHETVCLVISRTKSDVPLKVLKEPPYLQEQSAYLRMTPDFILRDPNRVIEIGTTQETRDIEQVHRVYKQKYADTRLKMDGAQVDAQLMCVVVSPCFVVSNVNFTEQEVNLLCHMHSLGKRIMMRVGQDLSLRPGSDPNPLDVKISEFTRRLPDLPNKGEHFLIMDKEKLEHWKKASLNIDKDEIVKKILTASIPDVVIDTMTARQRFEEQISLNKLNSTLRGSLKPPFQVPLLHIENKEVQTPSIVLVAPGPYERLWNTALLNNIDMDSEELIDITKKGFEWSKNVDRKFSRIPTCISDEDRVLFSTVGLFGKKYKSDNDEVRKESQKTFGLLDYTDDIDKLFSEDLMEETDFRDNNIDFLDLIQLQRDSHHFSPQVVMHYKEFSRTKLGAWLMMLSVLAQELNCDIVKKTTDNQMIFKKLKGFNVWYLAKPTGSHLFFSLLTSYKDYGLTCFKRPCESETKFKYYEFVSTDSKRISSMINCFENACVLWSDLSTKYCPRSDPTGRISKQKLLFAVCMMLENKQTTADLIYTYRPIVMKITSGSRYMDPATTINKTAILRSRFAVWFQKRVIFFCRQMTDSLPTRVGVEFESPDEEIHSYNGDVFDGLIDPISGLPELSLENAIFTSYLATYHSSGTMSKMAAEYKIIEKIVEYELKLRDVRQENCWKESPFEGIRPHEFNLSTSLLGGKITRERLEGAYGAETDSMIWDRFFSGMKMTFGEFATFKASLLPRNDFSFSSERNNNVKAIEAVLKTMHNLPNAEISPYEDLDNLFLHIFDDIQAKADLKNNQPTGVREILTMLMWSRYAIKPIESLMEWVNSHSASEVLSKGPKKEIILESFEKLYYSLREEGFELITIDQTIDHSKWCQMFVMPKFLSHLFPILPSKLFIYFSHILNTLTRKKILLSEDFVLSLFNDELLFSESLKELRDQFLGRSMLHDLIDTGKIALKNLSNMAQGWLQNTSSSDGDSDMQIVTLCLEMFVRSLKSSSVVSEKVQIHHVKIDSSDDQAARIIIKCLPEDKEFLMSCLPMITAIPKTVAKLNCKMMNNEKSTYCHLQDAIEFNQIYRSGMSMFVPTVKFDKAALEIPVTLDMTSRFYNFSNTRRNMIENGCDIFTTGVAQIMQAHLHYRSLGYKISNCFGAYKEVLMKKPHQSFGFFIQEPENLICLGGFELAKYHFITRNRDYGRVCKSMLGKLEMSLGVQGQTGPKVNFRAVNIEKYKYFKKQFYDVKLELKKLPEMLYRQPQDRKEMDIMLNKKGLDPSSELAFTYESTPKMMQMSSYFLREPVMKYWLKDGDSRVPTSSNISALMKSIPLGEAIDANEIRILNPLSEIFENMIQLSTNLREVTYHFCGDLTRRRSTLRVEEYTSIYEIPLIDCVKQVWFNLPTSHNRTLVIRSFDRYRERYSWLKETHDETLKTNLLLFEDDPASLYGTIQSLSEKVILFKMFSPLKTGPTERMISNYAKFNWKRGFITHTVKVRPKRPTEEILKIANMSVGPFSEGEKLRTLSQLQLDEPFDRVYSKNIRNLMIAKKVLEGADPMLVISMMRVMKRGFLSYYVKEQKFENGSYSGDFIEIIHFFDCSIRIEVNQGKFMMFTDKRHAFVSNKDQLLKYLRKYQEFMVNGGTRLTQSGMTDKIGEKGYPYNISQSNRLLGLDISKIELELTIDEMGKFLITNKKSTREKQVVYKFYLDNRDLPTSEEQNDNTKESYLLGQPMDLDQLWVMVDDFPEWTKNAFKIRMEFLYGQGVDLFYEEGKVISEEVVDEEYLQKIFSMISEEVVRADNLFEEEENLAEWQFEEVGDMSYQNPISKHTPQILCHHKMFNELIRTLEIEGLREVYLDKYKRHLPLTEPWSLFKLLTDYETRKVSSKVIESKIVLYIPESIRSSELEEMLEIPGLKVIYREREEIVIKTNIETIKEPVSNNPIDQILFLISMHQSENPFYKYKS